MTVDETIAMIRSFPTNWFVKRNKIIQEFKDKGFENIGDGAYYFCLWQKGSDFIVKILAENYKVKEHAAVFPGRKNKFYSVFLKPLFTTRNRSVIIQRYVQVPYDVEGLSCETVYEKLIDKLGEEIYWGDYHGGNIALCDGKPVIIDFDHIDRFSSNASLILRHRQGELSVPPVLLRKRRKKSEKVS